MDLTTDPLCHTADIKHTLEAQKSREVIALQSAQSTNATKLKLVMLLCHKDFL